jgi:hypothetical protein
MTRIAAVMASGGGGGGGAAAAAVVVAVVLCNVIYNCKQWKLASTGFNLTNISMSSEHQPMSKTEFHCWIINICHRNKTLTTHDL